MSTGVAAALAVALGVAALVAAFMWGGSLGRAWRGGDAGAMRRADRYGVLAVLAIFVALGIAVAIYVVTSVDEWS